MRDLVTIAPREVAAIIGASEWWVREMARQRKCPHLRLGRDKIRFRRADVLALIELVSVAPVGEPAQTLPDEVHDSGGGPAAALLAEANAAYILSKNAGRPEQAARRAARKVMSDFSPSKATA